MSHEEFREQLQAPNVTPELAELLSTSIEELRVVEEELVEGESAIAELRHARDERIRRERKLFDLAPVALFTTDCAGTILELNRAAATMLRGSHASIQNTALESYLPQSERSKFKLGLSRLPHVDHVDNWHLLLQAPGEAARAVSVTVHVARQETATAPTMLHWGILPLAGVE